MTPAETRIATELDRPAAARWFRAPGRVNLMGDHTDYNDGFVLPVAIDRACVVASRPGPNVRVRSLDLGGTVDVSPDGTADPSSVEPAWGRYVAGVVNELAALGRSPVGIDAVLASDIPPGAGLASSAALEVAVALALAEAAGWEQGSVELAQACRRAEERATGVPCGIMDQLASLAGVPDAALLIDCRALDVRPVRLPQETAILVVHSGVSRTLAGSAYADRRAACEELARRLDVPALRDATPEQVANDPLGRHVVSENARTLAAADALQDGDLERLGKLFAESHASLRDDFEISTPELDALVRALVEAGASGARLTGGGFGGCVVALCDADAADAIAARATASYRAATGCEAKPFLCQAVQGATWIPIPA